MWPTTMGPGTALASSLSCSQVAWSSAALCVLVRGQWWWWGHDVEHPKKGSSYMALCTRKLAFLDICNYLPAGGFSYAKYLRTYGWPACQAGKTFCPYKYVDDCHGCTIPYHPMQPSTPHRVSGTPWKRASDGFTVNRTTSSCAGSGCTWHDLASWSVGTVHHLQYGTFLTALQK